MKKINAFITWIVIVSLLGHVFTMTYSLVTGWYDFGICKTMARATGITVGIHVLLCLIVFFFLHDGSNIGNYKKQNKRTIVQRASAIVTVLLLHVHVKSFGFVVEGAPLTGQAKFGILITEIIFFASIFIHISSSFSKSLITMGFLREEKAEKITDIITRIICIILMIMITNALGTFLIKW